MTGLKPHECDEMQGRRAFLLSAHTKAYVNDKKSDLTKQVAHSCGFIFGVAYFLDHTQ